MLGRSLVRTIRSTLGRYLSIFAIIALGVGFFIGLRVTHDSMRKTADDYLTDLLFYDFRLVSTLGLTQSDVVAFQNEPNVLLAEGSVSVNALAKNDNGTEEVIAFHTLLPAMDRLDVVSGRLPEKADEIVLDALYAKTSVIGKQLVIADSNEEDTLDLFAEKTFRIVGTVNSPYYANFERGSTSLGSGKIAGFAYVLSGAFDSDYYTEILLRLTDMPQMGSDAYHDAADAAKPRLEDLLEERGDIRYTSLKEEANEKIADAQKEIDDGWDQIADGKKKIADAEKQLADAQKELRDARKELDDGWAELADAEVELADAKKELDDARKELDDAEAELADAEAELADGRKELDDAKIELADARKELDDGWADYYDGLQKYEDGKKEYEDGLKKYEDGLKEYEDGLAAYQDGRRDANAQLSAAAKQLSDAEAQLNETREQLDEAIAKKNEIEQSLPYLTDEKLAEAEAAVQMMSAEIAYGESAYEQGMNEYAAGKAAYEKAESSAKSQLRSARRKLDKAKEELDNAKIELDDAKVELEDAEVELKDALVKLEDGEAEYADGLKEYEDGEADYAEGLKEYEDGKKEYEDGLKEYEDGLKEYEDGLKEYEDGKKELEDGEAEYQDGLREYRTKSADAQKKISDAKADIEQAETDLTEGQEKIDDAKADLEDLKEPNVFVLGRDMNNGYAALENDTAIVKGIAKVFPLFFFLVAVLVCITTMTRMVDEQRTEDGTLKALGYSDGAIASRYLIYAASASLIGCFVGFFVGSKFMPMAIWKVYRIMYQIDRPAAFVLDWKMFGICTVLYILCSLGATYFVIHRELKEQAAQLIRPEAPAAGKRVLLERIPFIWKRLSFLRKVSIRNIFLYKKRMIMMIVGIGGCTALLLTGFGIRDTISKIVDYQYEEICIYDGAVTFADPLSESDEADFRSQYAGTVTDAAFISVTEMDVNHDGSQEANVVVFRDPLQDFVDIHTGEEALAWPGKGETVLDFRLARDLNISVGDTVTVVDDELRRMDLRVTGIFDNYLYDYVFVTEETFEDAFGYVPDYKNAYVNFPEDGDVHSCAAELLSSDDILDVTLAADLRSTIGSLLSSMDYIVIIVLICSGALAFIVLYNLTNISITERKREIATLKVLGFYQNETDQYVFRENLILTGIAAVFGIPAGIALLRYVMAQVTIKQMYFGCRLAPLSYVYSIVITFVFAILINLVLRRKIDNIDMAESMKAIE